MKIPLFYLVSVIGIILNGCNYSTNISEVEHAIYQWKSNNYLTQSDFGKLKVQKLYLKYFEVDYNEAQGNIPINKDKPSEYSLNRYPQNFRLVPCVYIRNEIFKFNNEESLDKLASDIVFLVKKYNSEAGINDERNSQIQIDCDWTLSTKDKYFFLLRKIKNYTEKEISCTLRLYPYKYKDKMGVPPVDKVMLMCYNIISPLKAKDKNSILDIEEFKKYFDKKINYPKHIDIALPTYNWSLRYQNGEFLNSGKLTSSQVKSFSKEIKPMWFEVQKDTSIDYYTFLRKGDLIKCEEVEKDDIVKAIDILKSKVKFDNKITVALFDINENTFSIYTHEDLASFYTLFMGH